ncbi:LysR family transcriptional regulator [Achromobacter aloeverae]|uniref:LysR family transcriptional regulator n=1 Tax=Achromobacter aloeverae TaxID=1750518 RepID=A0A4Q1HEW4_9BURK|nr:LysR family transcriptional regulator [Achromobacter aloeverae]RXN85122.1 LysR family transcriptional regulator [Achromobacter aloeverae]
MNPSLRDLSYFLAVVAHGHLGRAASACAVTQPALSKSLKRLEDETGLALFDRSARAVRPTAAGLAFAEHARKVVEQYEDAIRHAQALSAGDTGLLRVGSTAATMDTAVLPALEVLLPERPGLRVTLTMGVADELHDLLEQGALDVVVAPMERAVPAALRQQPVGRDDLRVVARRGHPLLAQAPASLELLAAARWILPKRTSLLRQQLDAAYAAAALAPPTPVLEVDFVSAGALKLVAGGDWLTVAPAALLEDASGVMALPASPPLPLRREVALLARRSAAWSPPMKAMREALQRANKNTDGSPA